MQEDIMAFDAEGSVYVPLDELWGFLKKFHPDFKGAEVAYGVPRVVDGDLVVDYAAGTECNPGDWATKPKAVTQWAEHKKAEREAEEAARAAKVRPLPSTG
jgi:hypothetical protein